MKVFIALLLINLFCPNYYTVDYDGDVHIFSTDDIHTGKVTLVMNSKGTEEVTDDEITMVIERS